MIYLGNLTIEDFERREDIMFSDADRKWLEEHRQDDANVPANGDTFHIFDIPLCFLCGEKVFDEVAHILRKVQSFREGVGVSLAVDSKEERERKLRKEKEALETLRKQKDPDKMWIKKWTLSAPVSEDTEYLCFINTYHRGYENIPSEISGIFSVSRDEEGLHGTFTLDDPEIDETEHPEWNHVVGLGYYRNNMPVKSGEPFSFNGRIEEHRRSEYDEIIEA